MPETEILNTTQYRILAWEQMELGGKIPKEKQVDNSIEVHNCTGEEQTPRLLFCQY